MLAFTRGVRHFAVYEVRVSFFLVGFIRDWAGRFLLNVCMKPFVLLAELIEEWFTWAMVVFLLSKNELPFLRSFFKSAYYALSAFIDLLWLSFVFEIFRHGDFSDFLENDFFGNK